MENTELIQSIEYNIAQESFARKYYYELIELLEKTGDYKAVEKVKEIISDEINHSIILMKIAQRLTGVKPSEFESILKLKKKGDENANE